MSCHDLCLPAVALRSIGLRAIKPETDSKLQTFDFSHIYIYIYIYMYLYLYLYLYLYMYMYM